MQNKRMFIVLEKNALSREDSIKLSWIELKLLMTKESWEKVAQPISQFVNDSL